MCGHGSGFLLAEIALHMFWRISQLGRRGGDNYGRLSRTERRTSTVHTGSEMDPFCHIHTVRPSRLVSSLSSTGKRPIHEVQIAYRSFWRSGAKCPAGGTGRHLQQEAEADSDQKQS